MNENFFYYRPNQKKTNPMNKFGFFTDEKKLQKIILIR